MQIKFKTAYSINTHPIIAQTELLKQWCESYHNDQVNFISRALVDFIDYDILEYPNQDQLKKEYTHYLSTFSSDLSDENVERCLRAFASEYKLMELTITVED